ncbi:MAG: hypothetical protein KAR62_05445 [Sphingomonadales bacterium]|nr:hypothetical protein [Sphingomonadales bacterium]
MMKRNENWQQALNETVEAARERPFSWGKHDCCLFAANCVEAMTGIDPMADMRGKYENEEGAREVLKTLGGKTLYRTMQKIFGQAIAPALAHRGDVVYRRDATFPSVGICLGDISVFVGGCETLNSNTYVDGLVSVETISCLKAFRV